MQGQNGNSNGKHPCDQPLLSCNVHFLVQNLNKVCQFSKQELLEVSTTGQASLPLQSANGLADYQCGSNQDLTEGFT